MKYEKERRFVKEVNEFLNQEVIASRIEIIQTSFDKNKEIYQVIYRDRFGKKCSVQKINNEYTKTIFNEE